MRLNPDRILEKLEEYDKLGREIRELDRVIYKLCNKILAILEIDEYSHEFEKAIRILVREHETIDEKLLIQTLEDTTKRAIADIKSDLYDTELEIPEVAQEEIAQLREQLERAKNIVREQFPIISKSLTRLRELLSKRDELFDKRYNLFGIIDGDLVTLSKLVKLVYKCIKYASEG